MVSLPIRFPPPRPLVAPRRRRSLMARRRGADHYFSCQRRAPLVMVQAPRRTRRRPRFLVETEAGAAGPRSSPCAADRFDRHLETGWAVSRPLEESDQPVRATPAATRAFSRVKCNHSARGLEQVMERRTAVALEARGRAARTGTADRPCRCQTTPRPLRSATATKTSATSRRRFLGRRLGRQPVDA